MGIHCAFCSHTGNEEGRSACAETESSLSALSRPRPDVGSGTNQLCLQRKKQYLSVKMAHGNMANKCKKKQHSECVINLDGSCFNTANITNYTTSVLIIHTVGLHTHYLGVSNYHDLTSCSSGTCQTYCTVARPAL